MNKHQRDISKDVKYLMKFFKIGYRQAKNYLKDYQVAKKDKGEIL